jgi:hypothetical protein
MQVREVTSDGYKMDPEQRRAEVRQSFTEDPPSGEEAVVYRFFHLSRKGRTGPYAVMRYDRNEVQDMLEALEADRVRFS